MEVVQFTQKENVNLMKLIRYRYLPYWPIYVVLMIIFGAGAYAYMRYATPYYEVTANILLKDEKSLNAKADANWSKLFAE